MAHSRATRPGLKSAFSNFAKKMFCNDQVSSCAGLWGLENPPPWRQQLGSSRVTADAPEDDNGTGPLRENVSRKNGACRHVPHREKPPQVVARRNARERKRVQAVNNAFNRLRKVVPVENSRWVGGK